MGRPRLRAQGAPAGQPARGPDAGRARACCWPPGWSSPAETSAPRWCCSRSARDAVGGRAPARLFAVAISIIGVAVIVPGQHRAERLDRLTNFADPFKDYHDAGWQPAHGLYALPGRHLRPGDRRQPAEVGRPARGPHRLHLRGPGRGARPGRHAAGRRPLPHPRVRAVRVARQTDRAVRPLHRLRHPGLAARPDDHQRRHGARAAAGHRHPAAAGLLRRLRADAVAGGARARDRLRPS